jgi:hypothetical protein
MGCEGPVDLTHLEALPDPALMQTPMCALAAV